MREDLDPFEARRVAACLFLKGANITQIAAALGVARPTIYKYLTDCGIDYKMKERPTELTEIDVLKNLASIMDDKNKMADEIVKMLDDAKAERQKKIQETKNVLNIKLSKTMKRIDNLEKSLVRISKKMDLLENTISQLVGLIDLMMTEEKGE